MEEDNDTAPPGGAPDDAGQTAAPEGASTEATTTTDTTETTEAPETEQQRQSRGDRRFAELSARNAAQAAELERLRNATRQPQPGDPHLTPEAQAYLDQRVAAEVARRTIEERAQRFHAEGRAQYPDWAERAKDLMEMGADAGFAELLLELPDGAKVAGALHDDPEELQRITSLRTERARAIALGNYAASLAPRTRTPRVSNAPAPIKPLSSGTARAAFNEYTASADELAEYYAKQAMDARRRG
jgi:hypothetical protein